MNDKDQEIHSRLDLYNYMEQKLISTEDESLYRVKKFKDNIHFLLGKNYDEDGSIKKNEFKVGDKVILSDLGIVDYFPHGLTYVPLISTITEVENPYIGDNCVKVQDPITGEIKIVNVLNIEKSIFNKEYILKLLIILDVSKKAFNNVRLLFLSQNDINKLTKRYSTAKFLLSDELSILENLAEKYLYHKHDEKQDIIRFNSGRDYELKSFFKEKLISLVDNEYLDDKVNTALKTYYLLYENTKEEYQNNEIKLLYYFIIKSFEYDTTSGKNSLTDQERLAFVLCMENLYNLLASEEFFTFDRLRNILMFSFMNSRENSRKGEIINSTITIALKNFNNNNKGKRYYK